MRGNKTVKRKMVGRIVDIILFFPSSSFLLSLFFGRVGSVDVVNAEGVVKFSLPSTKLFSGRLSTAGWLYQVLIKMTQNILVLMEIQEIRNLLQL
jgi:hypothetical protein